MAATSSIARKLALRQSAPAATRSFQATTPLLQNAGHVMPASGEQYTTPLGPSFNMNKSKMFCNQCSQHNKVMLLPMCKSSDDQSLPA